MGRRGRSLAAAIGFAFATCAGRAPEEPIDVQLALAVQDLASGRLDAAREGVQRARQRDPRHVGAAEWSAVIADLLGDDDLAVREWAAAVQWARAQGADAARLATLRGRLGDLLFRLGRWGESIEPLQAGATSGDPERRLAFAAVAQLLPGALRPRGPIVIEQPLLPGAVPELVCGAGDRMRPFAIDTGTSMTTVAKSFASELGVRGVRPAGRAVDGTGRELSVEVGALPEFMIGEVELGELPVVIVPDEVLRLRDFHGGAERVPRGVLGLDLLTAIRLTLAPDRGSVVLELPRGLPPEQSVPCVRVDGRLLVPVAIDGARLWFVLDTGASHSSLAEAGLLALPGAASRAVPTFRRVRAVGGSVVAVREVRDLVLRCGEARFVDVALPIVARTGSGLFPVHGVLGLDLLRLCRLTLDRGRARILALP
jgi:hypothetical protein